MTIVLGFFAGVFEFLTVTLKLLWQLSSFPKVRDERNRESRLWLEIPDTSYLGSGMTVVLGFLTVVLGYL